MRTTVIEENMEVKTRGENIARAELFPDENLLQKERKMNKIETKNVQCWYGDFHVLRDINIAIEANTITALIGPSGCGKSTCLRVFNRMNDLIEGFKIEGGVKIDGKNIYD